MSVIVKVLVPSKIAETSQTTQYISDKVSTIIDKFTATNFSGSAVTFNINLVTVGDIPGNNNLIVKNQSIAAGATVSFAEAMHGALLGSGDYISTFVGTSNALTIRVNGRVITFSGR